MPNVTWKFSINGTSENPWRSLYSLRFNPLPQHGEAKLDRADLALQSLSEENMTPAEIRNRLAGIFTEHFIENVVARYQPNTIVECTVTCTWS